MEGTGSGILSRNLNKTRTSEVNIKEKRN